MRNKKILVSGSNGYLGSIICNFLSKNGLDVLCVERNTFYKYSKPHEKQGLNWKEPEDLIKACDDVSVVIHTAGLGSNESFNSPSLALEINGLNTARISRAAKKSGVKLFIYLSTIHVYSDKPSGIYNEASIPQNLHPYCISHVVGENAVALFNSRNQKGISLRLSNIIGAPLSQNSNGWKLFLNDICRQAIEKSNVVLLSPRETQRDFLTISNFLNGIYILILEYDQLVGGHINFCSSYNFSIEKVVSILSERYEYLFRNKLSVQWQDKGKARTAFNNVKYENDLLLSYGIKINNNIDEEVDNVLLSSNKFFGIGKDE